MTEGVRVKGIRELQRSLRKYDRELGTQLRKELKAVGSIVQLEARARFMRYSPKSAAGYKVRVRQSGVSVEQSLRKVTGQHPDYGALQMRKALVPALQAKESIVVARVEQMLDHLQSRSF